MAEAKKALLFLLTFTLPMYIKLNNIVLGIYIMVIFFDFFYNKNKLSFYKKRVVIMLPVIIFFFLALIASLNSERIIYFKYLEKYLSFLLIPIAVSLQLDFYVKYKKLMFKALIYGCLATLLICNINVIYEIVRNNEPINYIFRWRHLGHEFTNVADTHPAYLGLFITVAVYSILNHIIEVNSKIKIGMLFFLTIGMFQLVSRTALLIYGCVCLLFLSKTIIGQLKKTLLLISFFIVIGVFFFSFGSSYLKERIFVIEVIKKDSRFERLEVSNQIFLENPILGIGFVNIESERVKKYNKEGFIIAAKKKYNAHNQFFEYLSINGVLGGGIYLSVFSILIFLAIKQRNYVFIFIFLSFLFSSLTESMMMRIKGIEYFSLFTALFLSRYMPSKQVERLN